MKDEFMKFLKEYGVIGLAIGVIIGTKAGELVKSIVDGLLMPIVGMVLPGGDWQTPKRPRVPRTVSRGLLRTSAMRPRERRRKRSLLCALATAIECLPHWPF